MPKPSPSPKPLMVVEESNLLFYKISVISSILLLAMSLLFYMSSSLLPAFWVTVVAVMILFAVCTRETVWSKKPMRIIVRSLLLFLVGVITIMAVISIIMTEVSLIQFGGGLSHIYYLQPFVSLFGLFVQFALVAVLPVIMAASYRGRIFDIMLMRVLAIMELVVGLFTCYAMIFGNRYQLLVFNMYNIWLVVLYGLFVALTCVSCFMAFPIKWRPKWYLTYRKKVDTEKVAKAEREAASSSEA